MRCGRRAVHRPDHPENIPDWHSVMNNDIFHDMKSDTTHSTSKSYIVSILRRRGRGYVFTAADFASAGTQGAVAQALSRLARKGVIRRLGRGVYDYPKTSKHLGALTPSVEAIANALARREGVQIQVSGARAANALGLSTQVPARATFLTQGTSRRRNFGGQSVELRRTVQKRMIGAGRRAGVALQGIRHLGPGRESGEEVKRVLSGLSAEERVELLQLSKAAPVWLQRIIGKHERAMRVPDGGGRATVITNGGSDD